MRQALTVGIGKTIVYCVAGTISVLPRRMQVLLGNLLGVLFSRWRRAVVEENLQRAYPHDEVKRRFIATEQYKHFGILLLELLHLLVGWKRFVKKWVRYTVHPDAQKVIDSKKPIIFLGSHVGNWEVMAAAGASHGLDLLIVTKQLKPEWLHRAIETARSECGVHGTYEPKTMKQILNFLSKGSSVAIVLDQYAGPPVGVRVPVFNTPVGTTNLVATLAKRYTAPVIPVKSHRQKDGTWEVMIQKPLEWITDEENTYRELALNTAQYAREVEKQIYDNPTQWLWTHRRFKGNLEPIQDGEWESARPRTGQ